MNNGMALLETNHSDLDRLIRFLARKYNPNELSGMDYDDLVQEGWMILVRSIDGYDMDRGKLMTWAYRVVKRKLTRVVEKHRGPTRNPNGLIHVGGGEKVKISYESDVEAEAMGRELLELFESIFSPQAFLLLLARREGDTYDEAAERLDLERNDIIKLRTELKDTTATLIQAGAISGS